ncbi:ComEC/Rec2 family competence protein [Spirillospora sp. CA-142024]|uniref:ComEC/Rec2 family competence protein n=1 Tax=Spirillospora sp. CA-142024 TaxID=3240036 RepID=UPI003D8F0EE1
MAGAVLPPRAGNAIAEAWFVDIGQGDCTLIVDNASSRALLVDCHTKDVNMVIKFIRANRISVDTAIVTHWDRDHYGGVARIAETLPLRRVFYNHDTLFPTDGSSVGVRSTLKLFLGLERFGTQLSEAKEGAAENIGSVSWKLLAPSHSEVTRAVVAGNRNIASAVVQISVGAANILVGGDAVADTWRRLLSNGLVHADILRWSHHGADLAGDQNGQVRDHLLAQIEPDTVIISAGSTNRYGHPSKAVVKAASIKARVMCTQVTPACFGHLSQNGNVSPEGRQAVARLASAACAGTVHVTITENGVLVEPDHEVLSRRIRQWPQPMCNGEH